MRFKYTSVLGEVIGSLINEKRSLGYDYESEEYKFRQLDELAKIEKLTEIKLSKEFVELYLLKKSHEKKSNALGRVQIVRELAKYMNRKGYEAYIVPPLPKGAYTREFIPYIFTDDEIRLLFSAVDAWAVSFSLDGQYYPQRKKYPIILRVLYSTGMRISEVLSLKVEDIDFKNETFTILKAKNHSERMIPVHSNVLSMIRTYLDEEKIFFADDYIFKGQNKKSHLDKKTMEHYFLKFLAMANIPHPKDGPRVHSFRHTFCVHRLREWVLEGRDINALFPYLCAYMGHADTRSTEYYLRLTADLYPNIVTKSEKYLYGETSYEE